MVPFSMKYILKTSDFCVQTQALLIKGPMFLKADSRALGDLAQA